MKIQFLLLTASIILAPHCNWAADATPAPRSIHVYVALCDNESQGISPVPEELGDGDAPRWNLYWGALYGVKTWFDKAPEWNRIKAEKNPHPDILERIVYRHAAKNLTLVADAYRGRNIRSTITDFVAAAHGQNQQSLKIATEFQDLEIKIGGGADLIAYIGHNGLMEFDVPVPNSPDESPPRQAIILACYSKSYFQPLLQGASARPILTTTGLMAPEAYTLKDAIDGWILGESPRQIRARAAQAYHKHQDCGLRAATNLFAID